MRLKALVYVAAAASGLMGQTAADARAGIRAAMEASAGRQRESVRKQAQAVTGIPEDSGWFTTPWPGGLDASRPVPAMPSIEEGAAPAPEPAKTQASLPCRPMEPAELSPMIETAAGRENLSPDLLRAVIRKESAFYPCAVSPKGAAGLMQLMPATAAALGVRDPLDAEDNVAAGAKFLGQMLQRYGGQLSLALAAYNAGPGKVDAHGGVPPYSETKNYVKSILDQAGASQ